MQHQNATHFNDYFYIYIYINYITNPPFNISLNLSSVPNSLSDQARSSSSSHLFQPQSFSSPQFLAALHCTIFPGSKKHNHSVFEPLFKHGCGVFTDLFLAAFYVVTVSLVNFPAFGSREVRRRAPLNSRGYPQCGCLQGSKHHWSASEYSV